MLLAYVVYKKKYKLNDELMEWVTAYITGNVDGAERKEEKEEAEETVTKVAFDGAMA